MKTKIAIKITIWEPHELHSVQTFWNKLCAKKNVCSVHTNLIK